MNILFVTHERNLNGASKSMLDLIDQLKNVNTYIIVTKYADGAVQDELKKRNIKMIVVPYYMWERPAPQSIVDIKWMKFKITWLLFGNLLNIYSAGKVKKALNGKKIDIIHVNTGVINLGIALKKTLGAPLVWHLREFGKEDFGMVPLVSERKFYNGLNHADGIIAISDAIYNKFAPHLKTPVVKRIYNGVGTKNINYDKKYHLSKNEKLIVLVAGRISSAKGQYYAIKAVQQLIESGYADLELWIAGRGKLEDIEIAQAGVKGIKLLGQVNDLPEIRKQVDLELVCSKCEAFGRVTVEAMLGGIPVIGSNSGGTPELILNGYNGVLVKYGDIEQLAAKIKMFYENRALLKEYGENARKYAVDRFLIERCASEVNDFYNDILTVRMK